MPDRGGWPATLLRVWPVTLVAAAVVTGGAIEFGSGAGEVGINTVQLAAAAAAVGAVVRVVRRRRLALDLAAAPYALLLAVPVLQALRDGSAPTAAGGLGRFASVLLLLLALAQFRDDGGLRGWDVPVTLMGAAVAALVVWHVVPVIGDPTLGFYAIKDAVQLPLGNHNYVGSVLAFALVVTLAAAPLRRGRAALVVLMAVGLALTFSRGAWLAFGLGALALALLRRDRRTLVVAGGLAAVVVALMAVVVVTADDPVRRLRSVVSPATGPRLDLWAASWDAFVARPLLGVGVDRLPEWMTSVRQPYLHAHNLVLETLGTTGVVGTVAYLAYWAVGALRAWWTPDPARAPLLVGLLVLFAHAQIDSLNYLLVFEAVVAVVVAVAGTLGDSPTVRLVGPLR